MVCSACLVSYESGGLEHVTRVLADNEGLGSGLVSLGATAGGDGRERCPVKGEVVSEMVVERKRESLSNQMWKERRPITHFTFPRVFSSQPDQNRNNHTAPLQLA